MYDALMPFRQLWERLTAKSNKNAVSIVPQRFLHLFNEHGIETPQIPRLLPSIKLSDLQSSENLLAVLTPEMLQQAARLFGVRVEWLEGVDDRIYEYLATGKQPEYFLEYLASLNLNPEESLGFPLRVITNAKQPDYKDSGVQEFAPVLVEKIAQLGEEPIYRYHIFMDGFMWGHTPARIELKAITRVVCKAYKTVAPLFVVSNAELEAILEGKLIPAKYLDGCQITNPSLEDYAESNDESSVAQEIDELPTVLEYIVKHRLDEVAARIRADKKPAPVTPYDLADAPATESPKPLGKRARTQAELWEPVRIAAKLLWADDDLLPIENVIKQIKDKNVSKASAFSSSAIRKHIADLAPPGVRGKSGRKPKKST